MTNMMPIIYLNRKVKIEEKLWANFILKIIEFLIEIMPIIYLHEEKKLREKRGRKLGIVQIKAYIIKSFNFFLRGIKSFKLNFELLKVTNLFIHLFLSKRLQTKSWS